MTRPSLLPACLLILSFSAVAQDPSCWQTLKSDIKNDAKAIKTGYQAAPSAAVKSDNLKWELPIGAATAVLIGALDASAARRIHSASLASNSNTASDVLLDSQIGLAAFVYLGGCATHRSAAREFGSTGLAAMGFASLNSEIMKLAFNRQRPYTANASGEFWEGGQSFPSGHATASWGLASALAARYPHHRMLKWSLFAVAAGTALLRFPARQHFPSDILVGGTLGYVSGRYIGQQ